MTQSGEEHTFGWCRAAVGLESSTFFCSTYSTMNTMDNASSTTNNTTNTTNTTTRSFEGFTSIVETRLAVEELLCLSESTCSSIAARRITLHALLNSETQCSNPGIINPLTAGVFWWAGTTILAKTHWDTVYKRTRSSQFTRSPKKTPPPLPRSNVGWKKLKANWGWCKWSSTL